MKFKLKTIPPTPWLSNYGDVPFNLDYPDYSICDAVFESAKKYPQQTALTFMGKVTTYSQLKEKIIEAAAAFAGLGIKEGDRVTICMPNVPQTVYALYGLNYIGALASMVHPLSAEHEIGHYMDEADSNVILTLDQFLEKIKKVESFRKINKIIIARVADALPAIKSQILKITQSRKLGKIVSKDNVVVWSDFICNQKDPVKKNSKGKDPAVILFSGGTTGVTKGILLSNLNFNALAMQTEAMCCRPVQGTKMLAAMPMFHGFGLGVCVHTMLASAGCSILVPRFNVKSYAKLIKKEKPNYIAGVPTLFEAITRNQYLDGANLSCLMGIFSGGDSLSIELKKKIDIFLANHNCKEKVREGYGTTECVTASCLTPFHIEKEGSIGLPYPDTYYTICKVGTTQPVKTGEEGEICICGPSVMLGYLNRPEETANTLIKHDDGNVWLHTGDLGLMDSEGFIYFKQRIKRMIITSGYNVYPSQLENVIDSHPAVQMSCVIGVRDPYKMQRVKAFLVLKPGFAKSDEILSSIQDYCKERIARFAMPYEIEIRDSLPKTLVGKIAYTVLEKEEEEKIANA